jgi:hypothetical protein
MGYDTVVQILDMNSSPKHVYLPKKLLCLKVIFSFFDLCGGTHVSTPKTTQFKACLSVFAFEEPCRAGKPVNCANGVARAGHLFYFIVFASYCTSGS